MQIRSLSKISPGEAGTTAMPAFSFAQAIVDSLVELMLRICGKIMESEQTFKNKVEQPRDRQMGISSICAKSRACRLPAARDCLCALLQQGAPAWYR